MIVAYKTFRDSFVKSSNAPGVCSSFVNWLGNKLTNAFSMAIFGPIISYLIWKLCKDKINKNVAVFLAASIGDLATYTLTSLQLGLAFPDPVGGFAVSAAKFLGIFFITQIPIAIAEGLLTTIIYNFITENEDEEVLA